MYPLQRIPDRTFDRVVVDVEQPRLRRPVIHNLAAPCRRLFEAEHRMRNVCRFEFRDFLRR
jgi:hypothetical protein